MLSERFYIFTLLIDGIHKSIHKIKFDFAPEFGVKSVHIFWIYELYAHPNGLTSAELAGKSMISRSLVSREIEWLRDNGYIQMQENPRGKRKNYNARITLTEKGEELARRISNEALTIQNKANQGISEEELIAFYSTLEKFYQNLQGVISESENLESPPKNRTENASITDFTDQITEDLQKSLTNREN